LTRVLILIAAQQSGARGLQSAKRTPGMHCRHAIKAKAAADPRDAGRYEVVGTG
jgi:hypothetical protein